MSKTVIVISRESVQLFRENVIGKRGITNKRMLKAVSILGMAKMIPCLKSTSFARERMMVAIPEATATTNSE